MIMPRERLDDPAKLQSFSESYDDMHVGIELAILKNIVRGLKKRLITAKKENDDRTELYITAEIMSLERKIARGKNGRD